MVFPTPNQDVAESLRTSGLLRAAMKGVFLSYCGAAIYDHSSTAATAGFGELHSATRKQYCHKTPAVARPIHVIYMARRALPYFSPGHRFGNILARDDVCSRRSAPLYSASPSVRSSIHK